ncbi:hypothetical protein ET445_12605 [Agromyces protaetiae]|uniref:Prealbumin-like fold domain-containing protein n=1 Tax=Agromyces protaetiae TaxID=2509455 RepID=A0A4P6FG23_9MICO|nr:SpaA isopeptide-forming pilin-related protein [Agromyces protaetiae]QAY74053.1 hypothetical protein ET445_12605 [Agromyces protaetiae]
MDTVQKARARRVVGALVALSLALGGLLAGAAPASAAIDVTHPNAISNIQLEKESGGDGPLHQWELVRITADWAVPDGALPGETFGMTLPAEFARYGNGTFDLVDPATGAVLATCVITQGNGPEIICTLTDAVLGLENIGGSFWMTVQATKSSTEDHVEFIVGDEYIYVDLPGEGGIIPEDLTAPERPFKYSGPTAVDGRIQWTIGIPASYVQNGAFTVSDALDPAHENHHYTGDLWLSARPVENGVFVGTWTRVDPSFYTVQYDGDLKSFDFEAHGLPSEALFYRLTYTTDADGIVVEGDIFGNTATVGTTTTSTKYTYESAGGGIGTGDMYTRFMITKALTGEQSDAAAGAVFTVRYAVKESADAAKTMQLTVGQPARSDRAPIGSTFVIEEIDFPEIAGVAWNDWTLTGEGVVANGDGTWDVTPATAAGVELVLTNQADAALGHVTWSKVDPGGAALDGSEWELRAPDGTVIPVVDNGTRDADPVAGELDVIDLVWGDYTLVETKAPDGYQRTDEVYTVTVDGGHLEVSFGDIVNAPAPPAPPIVPEAAKTGPAGTATTGVEIGGIVAAGVTLLAGGAIIALAADRRRAEVRVTHDDEG